MGKKLLFVGAGAIGSYLGAFLARAGHDVMLVDPWAEQVEAIRQHGISVTGPHDPFVARPAATLSPGERTRAELAAQAALGANCLVLDEPTNHLDLPAIEELETALAGYTGTVVLVTHDRRLLERFGATRTIGV